MIVRNKHIPRSKPPCYRLAASLTPNTSHTGAAVAEPSETLVLPALCRTCFGTPFLTSARTQNYPGWDEGWLTVVRQRIQIEDEVVEDIAELGLDGVEAESQVTRQVAL